MGTASVVIPVRDGARYLGEVLAALAREGPEEVLVIDSGSRDGSVDIARAAGVELLEIAPEAFGHGRTRNLGVERTSGELVLFLTQDATPRPGWLAAHREALALEPRVGATFGPHLPRPGTSPMIARELTEFFAPFAPDGRPTVQRGLDDGSWHPGFLSNVDAGYRREALAAIGGFRDIPYAEDQAAARDLFAAGWAKAYHPAAAVLHAHDYGWAGFMRRYFDEYRGLRETVGHVERIGVRSTARHVRSEVTGDRRWLSEQGATGPQRAAWTARSAAHHAGRRVASALGSRAAALPGPVQAALSLEGRGQAPPAPADVPPPTAPPRSRHRAPTRRRELFDDVARLARSGPAPLLEPRSGTAQDAPLHVAVVIPPFRIGSGGHNSIFQLCLGLERFGHSVSIWLADPTGRQKEEWPGVLRATIREHFAPLEAPVYSGFDDWFGADVAVATGWETVHPVLLLEDCRARAYLVHDHEPEFHATSAESRWAEETYRFGLFHIAASPWLRTLLEERYGAVATTFRFGVDHETYRPQPVERRWDTVLFYSRHVTPRRAVPLGLLALAALHVRRPDVRIVLFGDHAPPQTSFPFEHVGVAGQAELAALYGEATVGLVLSMTNYSLVPQEMMACGLPCVDLAGFSAETVFGPNGPVELAAFDPDAIAGAVERLLDDRALWEARSEAGQRFVAEATWDRAAREVEAGLREALGRRERVPTAP
jgi:glycosyltransferase involved in cell wall biosynthesis/GT2 family glycosyltransferase